MAAIWRIGAGDKEKDLVPTMLKHGVMMVGPGRIGDLSGLEKHRIHRALVEKWEEGGKGRRADMLISFRDEAKTGELVTTARPRLIAV